jgi:CRISPR-associated exonuclease Cas4
MAMTDLGGMPFVLVIGLLLLAAVLWHFGRRWQEESGLPEGSVIYTDTGAWRPNASVLHAADVRLVGKPDYLVEQRNGLVIPVEVKSSLAPNEPWDDHILQLAAYCLLVEENYGVRPPYGIIQYRDRAFAIDYTEDLEADLLYVLDEMRRLLSDGEPERDHDDPRICAGCGVRRMCNQRLA